MLYVIIGLLVFIGFLWFKHWFIHTPAAQVRQKLSTLGLLVGIILFLFLLVTGRLAWIWAAGVAVLPWIMRLISTWRIWQKLQNFTQNYKSHGHGGQTSAEEHSEASNRAHAASSQTMSPQHAAEILGLSLPTSRAQIIAAHRALMKRHHPDHGGNDHTAQMLNQARETLLQVYDE